MDLIFFSMILFYWMFLSGVVFVTGAFASRAYVTGPSGVDVCMPAGSGRCYGESASRVILTVSLVTLFVNVIHFILHCSVMTETPLQEVFSILPAFITKTKYGRFTILRTLFLGVVIILSLILVKRQSGWATGAGIIASCGLLLMIAMSGHQGARGYLNVPFYLDVIHLIAVSLWIGGLFYIRSGFSSFMKKDIPDFLEIFRSFINRFSQLATYSVAVAGITGVVLLFVNVEKVSIIVDTLYGRVLMVKVLTVGILFILGGINKFYFIPHLNSLDISAAPEMMRQKRMIFRTVTAEVCIGLAVLLLTSLLTHLSPEG